MKLSKRYPSPREKDSMFVLGDLRDICSGRFASLWSLRFVWTREPPTFCGTHNFLRATHTHTYAHGHTDAHSRADTCFAFPRGGWYIYGVTAASAWLRPLSRTFLRFKATFLILVRGSEISVARLGVKYGPIWQPCRRCVR